MSSQDNSYAFYVKRGSIKHTFTYVFTGTKTYNTDVFSASKRTTFTFSFSFSFSPSRAASPATVNSKARADWRAPYEFKCCRFKRQVYGRIIERSLALACIRHRLQHAVFLVRCVFEWCEHTCAFTRDGRYLLFYFRSDTDIFKPNIVDIDTDTDTCKLKWSFKLLKEYNQ